MSITAHEANSNGFTTSNMIARNKPPMKPNTAAIIDNNTFLNIFDFVSFLIETAVMCSFNVLAIN